jgi:Cdc6-like AAA superfamily ATPase
MRFIPKDTKIKMRFYKHITVVDIILGLGVMGIISIILASNLPYKFVIGGVIAMVFMPLFLSIGQEKLYVTLWYMVRHLFGTKKFGGDSVNEVENLILYDHMSDNTIHCKDGTHIGALTIQPLEFSLLSQEKQDFVIDGAMTNIYNSLNIGQVAEIVKLDNPLNLNDQLETEVERIKNLIELYEKGNLTEQEYIARMNIVEDRGNKIDYISSDMDNTYTAYYFVLHDKDSKSLQHSLNYIRQIFLSAGVEAKLLMDDELVEFVNLSLGTSSAPLDSSNDSQQDNVDTSDGLDEVGDGSLHSDSDPTSNNIENSDANIESNAPFVIPNKIEFNLVKTIQDNQQLTHFAITNYPLNVGNAWGVGLFDLPHSKVAMKLLPIDKAKAVKRIDNAVMELSSRRQGKASEIISNDTHMETLSALLTRLQNGNETLLDCTITITVYDQLNKTTNKKLVAQRLKELGFQYSECIGRQQDVFASVGLTDKLQLTRGIQSSSIAACFPFVSNAIVENNGLLIGQNDLPVLVDFFKRDNERVNSNMVIVGKPGSGKSYATKSLLCNLASTGAKVLVLDPENEYGKMANSLGGKVLDVASNAYGVINPLQIIGSLKEGLESSNDFYSHLRFLEQFLRVTFVGLNSDCFEILNKIVLDTYASKNIDENTQLDKLSTNDYPIFDDISNTLTSRLENEKDSYTLTCLKNIQNYLSKFCNGGRNSSLWNGHSTFALQENFVVFNFQRLLADKNESIANAQMLLILKWVENEIIQNREYNTLHNTHRKIIIAIDEAHLFVNEQYPVALDFMFQLAKRIRKYDGMQIVITQNIKDFAGTPEIARKSTAIINVSQYSLIFSLSPNDMTDLCKLYEKAGEINESEQASIVYNPRGSVFFIYGPSSRTNIGIEATEYVESLFM